MEDKKMIKDLITYIHNLLEFVDVENFEDDENVAIVKDGYEEFVKPAVEYISKKEGV